MNVRKKDGTIYILGFSAIIGTACIIGIVGGFLFGIWDSFTVMIDRGIAFDSLREMFYLSLYAVAVYTVLGFLGMTIIGFFSSIIVKTGKYNVSKKQLARVFIGIFTLLAVSVILADLIIYGNMADILETTIIGIFCGIGTGVFSIFLLTHASGIKLNMKKLITLGISFFIPLLVFIYGGLLINIKLLSSEPFYHPLSLLSNIGLFIFMILLAIGLYRLINSLLTRYSNNGVKWTSYTLISIMLCVFIVISLVGPFNGDKVELIDSGDATGKPNILWIVMDTVRADHLSCYGYYRNTTPNIDKIASEGILYENTISAAPYTLPSHASMFTGSFPSRHGTDEEYRWLENDFHTIAELLQLSGYNTFGYSNNEFVSSKTNLNQGFNTFITTPYGRLEAGSELADFLKVNVFKRRIQNLLQLLEDEGASRTNETVKKWITDSNNSGIPFFIFINYMEAHHYYNPPNEYIRSYLGDDINISQALSLNNVCWDYMAGKVQLNDDDFSILRALYDGEISYLDFRIQQLYDYLKENKILDETVVIITADHGENFGEHNLWGHCFCVYDSLVHVPLIIRYPELFKAGLRIDDQIQLTDIFPTILDIVNIDWDGEKQIQGYSLLKKTEQTENRFAIAEHSFSFPGYQMLLGMNPKRDVSMFARRLKTIRTEEYKYIWASDGHQELYNIRNDPEELNNILEIEPEKVRELKNSLIEWLYSFDPYRSDNSFLLDE